MLDCEWGQHPAAGCECSQLLTARFARPYPQNCANAEKVAIPTATCKQIGDERGIERKRRGRRVRKRQRRRWPQARLHDGFISIFH